MIENKEVKVMNEENRVPYAREDGRCHDCGVLVGELHHDGCDVERCPFRFTQRITCECGMCEELELSKKMPFGNASERINREETTKSKRD